VGGKGSGRQAHEQPAAMHNRPGEERGERMLRRAQRVMAGPAHGPATHLSTAPLPQAFTSIAKDVMQRLQQEQVDQQAASAQAPLKLTSQLDRAKQRQKRGCCES
jgi:hypothetical protein